MKTTIFVVDDERSIADTLVTILNTQGYLAVAFYDAKSALAKCSHLQPEIVLSDVVMPGMNGVDMAVEIEQRYPACRVILFSGQVGTVTSSQVPAAEDTISVYSRSLFIQWNYCEN